MLNKSMNLDKGVDIYSKEVYQNVMAWVSNINKYNQYFSIFGEFQMVIEYLGQNTFCNFNSFQHNPTQQQMDIVAGIDNNQKMVMYNKKDKKLYVLNRNYPQDKYQNRMFGYNEQKNCSEIEISELF